MSKESSDVRLQNLELKRAQLDREYQLAHAGLRLGSHIIGGALLGVFATLGAAILALLIVAKPMFSGTQLVILFAVIVAAIVLYFSFVFARVVKIRVALSEVEREIEIEVGRSTR